MSEADFDKTTLQRAADRMPDGSNDPADGEHVAGFICGRNNVRGSLEILARALEKVACECRFKPFTHQYKSFTCARCEAIDEVKARGDWPI